MKSVPDDDRELVQKQEYKNPSLVLSVCARVFPVLRAQVPQQQHETSSARQHTGNHNCEIAGAVAPGVERVIRPYMLEAIDGVDP